jgi:hypothetical protein
MAKKSKKEKVPFKQKFEETKTNETFIASLGGLQGDKLKEVIITMSKQLEQTQFAMEDNEEIQEMQKAVDTMKEMLDEKKAELKDILSPFTDTEKSLKDKMRYVTLILKEKTQKSDGSFEA